ncbi:hypothetical protein [Streptosporangium sp. KLBMP 9127]|nr:hypothetical protein [Streptosporangium sp. KLBMP 9127]
MFAAMHQVLRPGGRFVLNVGGGSVLIPGPLQHRLLRLLDIDPTLPRRLTL